MKDAVVLKFHVQRSFKKIPCLGREDWFWLVWLLKDACCAEESLVNVCLDRYDPNHLSELHTIKAVTKPYGLQMFSWR